MKKAGIVLLIVGIVLLLVSLIWPLVLIAENSEELGNAGMGIIGGIGAPTFWFMYRLIIQTSFLHYVFEAGVMATIVSVIMLLWNSYKNRKRR